MDIGYKLERQGERKRSGAYRGGSGLRVVGHDGVVGEPGRGNGTEVQTRDVDDEVVDGGENAVTVELPVASASAPADQIGTRVCRWGF